MNQRAVVRAKILRARVLANAGYRCEDCGRAGKLVPAPRGPNAGTSARSYRAICDGGCADDAATVARIRELLAQATPEPWGWSKWIMHDMATYYLYGGGERDTALNDADLDLIAALRTHAEALLAAVEERDALRARLSTLTQKAADRRG
jgi:hypothetical protein